MLSEKRKAYLKAYMQKYNKIYKQEHKEHVKELNKQYIQRNKERLRPKFQRLWKNYYEQNKEELKTYKKEYHKKNLQQLRDYEVANNIKCVRCGKIKVDWHHVDPKTKSFTVSSMASRTPDFNIILEELKKCIPLCHSCHSYVHRDKLPNLKNKESKCV